LNCHCCQGETKRFGRFQNRNRVVQRYRCVRCGKTFSESQPLDGVRVDSGKAAQVVRMLCEGLGIRSTSRLTGLDQKTVLNILQSAGAHCATFLDVKLRDLKAEPTEVDECWTFVSNKRGKENTDTTGDFYAYLASGKLSKLIISYATGKREYSNGAEVIQDLKDRVAGRFQLTSDGWAGFIRGVLDQPDDKIDYAYQIKKFDGHSPTGGQKRRYADGKCISVRTVRVLGSPMREHTSTSHAERLNLSLRHFNKRFTRLSPCFSKKLENLEHSVALTVAYFNFCRPHKSLKIEATEADKAMERTPAMAAGLAAHILTVEELLSVVDLTL
jgi:transposase-like protein/IS1 family transposase